MDRYTSINTPIHDTLFEESKVIGDDFINKLSDIDVCIMHDIHYQGWHLVHNLAIRYAQKKLPKVKFIAMTHSIPDTFHTKEDIPWPYSARYSPIDNTIYAYPTESGLYALATQYKVDIDRCKVINNSIDLLEGMSDEVKNLHNLVNIISSDILIVYPARLTSGKNFEKVAMLAGCLKRVSGLSVKVIFCEFQSMDTNPNIYKKQIINSGINFGLNKKDIIFISDYGYHRGLKRESILDLFTLSNIYICPSLSESFGLTVLEASSRGNLLILNECVPSLKEIGDTLGAYFMRWDARNFFEYTKEIYHPSEEEYYLYHANQIITEFNNNKVIKAKTLTRKRYNPKWIFENQLKPLLYQSI